MQFIKPRRVLLLTINSLISSNTEQKFTRQIRGTTFTSSDRTLMPTLAAWHKGHKSCIHLISVKSFSDWNCNQGWEFASQELVQEVWVHHLLRWFFQLVICLLLSSMKQEWNEPKQTLPKWVYLTILPSLIGTFSVMVSYSEIRCKSARLMRFF